MRFKYPASTSFSLALFLTFSSWGCGGRTDVDTSDLSPKSGVRIVRGTPEVKVTTVEGDVEAMRIAGINRIFVIRKPDGSVFDNEDRAFLRANIPLEVNRISSSEGGKAFVVGSTFIMPEKNVSEWKTRFKVIDKSVKK